VRSLFRKDTDSTGTPRPFVIEEPTTPPPGFSELDRILTKIKNSEELTEEELRVLSVYLPNLSPPPAKHEETPPGPPAKHSGEDTRKGLRWMELCKKADMLDTLQKTAGGKK